MQKKVIALAVAGLVSGAAFAQSNVTVFGVADMGYVYSKGDTGAAMPNGADSDTIAGVSGSRKFSGMTNGIWQNSRLGFKGEEGLGNGLKAVFFYEFGLKVDGDTGINTTRHSYVGLDTPYGLVNAGKLWVASTKVMAQNSALNAITSSPITTLQRTLISTSQVGANIPTATMTTGGAAWWNNAIGFQSKTYAGFSGSAFYAFGETGSATGLSYNSSTGVATQGTTANTATAKTTDNGKLSLGLSYKNGPFNADVVYHSQMNNRLTYPDVNSVANNKEGKDINEWYVGGAYDFKAVKVMASYQTLNDKTKRDIVGGIDMKLWSVGAIVPIGSAGKFRVEYAKANFDQDAAVVPATGFQRDGSSGVWGVGYTHDMSKRTTLYTILTRASNDKNSIENNVNATGVGVRGESNFMFAAGVSHRF